MFSLLRTDNDAADCGLCAGYRETNEELQAAMLNKGLEEGRTLLSQADTTNSLAAEFEAMSENEVRTKLEMFRPSLVVWLGTAHQTSFCYYYVTNTINI